MLDKRIFFQSIATRVLAPTPVVEHVRVYVIGNLESRHVNEVCQARMRCLVAIESLGFLADTGHTSVYSVNDFQ